LLFLGKLTARKGLPELLEALAHDDVAPLPWRLRVAGDGDPRDFVERAAALGIAERVSFVGWVAEERVHDLLRETDVFVLPSHNEGLSVAMLEAMAHGCAVVATPVGATLDAVTDGESALVVPAGDPQRLAAALRRVIDDPALRATLQAGARQRWCDSFQITAHCRQLAVLYGELCPALAPGAGAPQEPAAPERIRARAGA
jgi:glycosyltransferase involved in cell wall biosynthesis